MLKLHRGLYLFGLALGCLALAACGAGGGAASPTAAAPAPTLPANPTAAPAATAAYPFGTPPPALPGYPPATPGGGAYPYPYPAALGTAPAAQGNPVDQAMIDLAKKDLAQRVSAPVDQITVVSTSSTEWADASLGCPKPGIAYAQVITPGYRIVLGQGQKQYEYHTDLKAALVLCTP